MRLMLDTTKVMFTVTRAPEPRKDFGKDQQKVDRDTGRPQWLVEVLALDSERGEVIRVTVAGDQPKVPRLGQDPGWQPRLAAPRPRAPGAQAPSGVPGHPESRHGLGLA